MIGRSVSGGHERPTAGVHLLQRLHGVGKPHRVGNDPAVDLKRISNTVNIALEDVCRGTRPPAEPDGRELSGLATQPFREILIIERLGASIDRQSMREEKWAV